MGDVQSGLGRDGNQLLQAEHHHLMKIPSHPFRSQ